MYEEILRLWQSYEIKTSSDLDKYLNNFKILFAYHSGRIENSEITYHDTREIFENGRVLNFTGSPRTLFEEQNQKACFEMLKHKIVQKEQLSVQLVKETHRILTEGTYDEAHYIKKGERPGQFKSHDYITSLNGVGSSKEEIEGYMYDLLKEINEYISNNFLKVAAYFHARFEYIHPFADGNGRTGRMLINYFLMINDHAPLIIFDEDKKLYYECLQAYDEKEDIIPLEKFLNYEIKKTWESTIDMVKSVKLKRKGLNDYKD